jgi:hypothetical protein
MVRGEAHPECRLTARVRRGEGPSEVASRHGPAVLENLAAGGGRRV